MKCLGRGRESLIFSLSVGKQGWQIRVHGWVERDRRYYILGPANLVLPSLLYELDDNATKEHAHD